ncbi:hypothetical protein ACO1O0_000502 [Amphichorda felina]
MADKKQQAAGPTAGAPADANSAPATIAEYKKSQQRVRELVEKRRMLERRLGQIEDGIAAKELAYLDSTPSGNIITGFDNYMKGQSGAAAQRRKTGPMEQNRVFSKSSISYKANSGDGTPGSTPASHAPTPVSGSFRDSGTGTPTGTGSKRSGKKKEADDSEADAPGKKRTNFGAQRK